MRRRAVWLWLFLGCAALVSGADFSGTWTLSAARSQFGPGAAAPQSLTMTVRQTETRLVVESRLTDGRGSSASEYTLDLTGKEAVNTVRGNRVVSVSAWRGAVLHVKARTLVQGVEVKTVDEWHLDGGVLTIYRTAATPAGELEQRFVYEKSPTTR